MATNLAVDAFARTLSSDWGSADLGGAWTKSGGDAAFSVSSGKGRMSLQASFNREALLNAVSSTVSHVRVELSSDSAYNGGVQSFTIIGRKTATGYYTARVRIESGLLRLYIMRDETALVGSTTINYSYVAGDVITVDLLVSGTGPTTISAKMWRSAGSVTDTEPGSYQQTFSDSTAGFQVAGSPGLRGVLASGAANAILAFDNYLVEDPTATVLDTPVVVLSHTPPSTVGGSDGTITATWAAVANAHHYESDLQTGVVTSGFTADDTNAVSPKVYTGLSAGPYTVAVRAKATA